MQQTYAEDAVHRIDTQVNIKRRSLEGIDPRDYLWRLCGACCSVRISEHRDRPFRLIVTAHFANA